MGDILDATRFLYEAGAGVVPFMFFALVVFVVYKIWPYMVDYLKARTDAQQAAAEREAERNEIMRNSNAVIENNTESMAATRETMGAMRKFMAEMEERQCAAVNQHEALSAERFERMQSGIDGISAEVGKMRGEHGILLDRVRP